MTTQYIGGLGYGGRGYGSFAGKQDSSTVERAGDLITQYIGGLGYGGRQYGAFSGKEESAAPVTAVGFASLFAFWLGGGSVAGSTATTIDVAGPGGGRTVGMPQYGRGERRKRGLEWKKERDTLQERLEAIYARLAGDLAEAVNEPGTVREAIAPFVQSSDAAIPPAAAVDFTALTADLVRVEMLLQAYEAAVKAKADMDQDEEDAIVALLLA